MNSASDIASMKPNKIKFASVSRVLCLYCCCIVALVALFSTIPLRAANAPLDFSDWTLRIGSQIITADPDGSFLIANIQAPDQFGEGGPGTRPDFLSDDFLRIVGTSTKNGITLYCFTEFFRIRQGQPYFPTNWTFTAIAPPVPVSIRAVPDKPALTQLNSTTRIRVTAKLQDGSSLDVSSGDQWTTFRTSNPNILGVDSDGLLTAKGRGKAYITAINDSATAVAEVDVVPGGELTTVHGLVQTPDGTPVPALPVTLVGIGGTSVTLDNGSFTILGVAAELRIAGIIARGPFNGKTVFGRTGALIPVPSGVTDAGIIVVRTCEELNIDCTDTDNDCLPDSIERALKLDPLNPDTGNTGVPDGDKDTDKDGIPNCLEVLLGTNPGKADTDGDGISDYDEIYRYGTDPLNPDTDGDSLSDGDEIKRGTNPLDPDTDKDGWNDGGELLSGSDPLNAESVPLQESASDVVFYLNGLDDLIPRRTLETFISSSVSYLNGSVSTFADTAPYYTPLQIASASVSYLNGVGELEPQSLLVAASSQTVSYLNGILSPQGPNSFVISPIVSFKNEATALSANSAK